MTKDEIGERMKAYEAAATVTLLPRLPVIARLDGRAFHTFCTGLRRPYDERLSGLMERTTQFLVEETNANCGYTQSDEISLVWHTHERTEQMFFERRHSKLTSTLAAMASVFFNRHLPDMIPEKAALMPMFDARVFVVPTEDEAANHFVWREMDATRNSISMAAQSKFSHSQLFEKDTKQMQEMLFSEHGINWNDYPGFFKRGTYLQRQRKLIPFSTEELDKLPAKHQARSNPDLLVERWKVEALKLPPILRIKNRVEVLLFGAEPDSSEWVGAI